MIIRAKKLHPDAILPTKVHPESDAAFDLYAINHVYFGPGTTAKVNTYVALEIPPGYFGLILGRSGRASVGIAILGGCIDSGYRGPIKICLANLGPLPCEFNPGDRAAQLVILPVPQFSLELVDELSPSDRDTSGFGSSGR